ncbi:HYR domain-containing protein [Paracrocinitomix mangrovi]|nr:HYR domain-containing protein [Paracrocinitomix mangrovi]
MTVNSDPGVCGATVTYTAPVGADNCPGSVTAMTAGQASGTIFPIGTTTVTYQVTDASGNTAQCSFDVTVNDNEAPTISCPADINVNNDLGSCGAIVTYTIPVGADNCPGSCYSYDCWTGVWYFYSLLELTTVTYQVTDASGTLLLVRSMLLLLTMKHQLLHVLQILLLILIRDYVVLLLLTLLRLG